MFKVALGLWFFVFYYTMLLFVMSLQVVFNAHAYTFDMCNNKVYLLTYLLTYNTQSTMSKQHV